MTNYLLMTSISIFPQNGGFPAITYIPIAIGFEENKSRELP